MIRQWKEFGTGDIKTEPITLLMVSRTQAYADRIGFPCMSMQMAVQSYENPETNEKYTEAEARAVLEALGVDVEKDNEECRKEFEAYQKWCDEQPRPKDCKNCGHTETWHHLYGTDKCQMKDCPCETLVVED